VVNASFAMNENSGLLDLNSRVRFYWWDGHWIRVAYFFSCM